jgi:hypothetical protein
MVFLVTSLIFISSMLMAALLLTSAYMADPYLTLVCLWAVVKVGRFIWRSSKNPVSATPPV